METIKVKPTSPDLVVLDDRGRRIPAAGMAVKKTVYYVRLIKAGDLEEFGMKKKKESEVPK